MHKLLSACLVTLLAVTSALLLSPSFVSTAKAEPTVVATIPVGLTPLGVAYDSGTGEVFVANFGSNTVSVISDVTNSVVATIPVGSLPWGVAYDSGKGEVFVTNLGSSTVGTVSVISDLSNTVVATVSVGFEPFGVAYDSGKGEVFVTNGGLGTVSVISDLSNTVVATVSVGSEPFGVAYDSGKGEVFVTNRGSGTGNTVSVISDVTNTVVATVPVGLGPDGVAYDSGKGEVFVTNVSGGTVSVISDVTNTVVATLPVGSAPLGVAYDSGTGEVFVANFGSNTTSVISEVTNSVVATVPVGLGPDGVAYDSGKGEVFVTNRGSGTGNTVSVISDGSASVVHTTSTNVICNPSTVVVNQATSCTATVTDTATGPTTPTGTVTFTPDGACILAGAGDSAACSVDITPTATGTLPVSATYGGDTTHQTSSGSFTVSVNSGALSVSFTVSANPTVGSPVTFNATVTGGTPPYTFSWDFGDGSALGTGNPVTHTYASEGAKTVTLTVTDATSSFTFLNDTWKFSAGTWTQLSPTSSPPSPTGGSMAYDAADGYVLLFGGVNSTGFSAADTWEFHAGQWTQLFPSSSPSPRIFASMAYDAADGYVLLFGSELGDTWEFHAGQWTQLFPSSSPSPRITSMAYDAADGYVLLFGGTESFNSTTSLGDTWEFHAGQWTQLFPSSSPSPRIFASMAYDAADGYVLLFGGVTVAPSQSTTSQTISISPTPTDFTISASPASVTVPPDTGISTITIAPTNGFTGTVDLIGTIFPATGLTCTLTPTSITGGSGTSMLSCSGIAGSYIVTVTGTSGLLSHSVDVVFTIAPAADFTIFASPASVNAKVDDTGTSSIVVNGFNGFTATVDLTHVESPTTGLTCSLSPTSITGGSGSSTLSCSGVAGIYIVTVSGDSGTASHSVDVSFIVTSAPDFNISADPASVNIVAGDTGTSTITISPVNSFTGTVDLTHLESPVGLTCSLSPTMITSASGISTLSCTGSVGIYTVTVSGISGPLTHSVGVTFVVTPPLDFAISTNPTGVTIVEGETGTSTVTVDSVNGFTGTVSLTSTIFPAQGLTCTLSPTEVMLGISGTSDLSCTGAAGTYTVAVVGTSGSLTHSVHVTFIVNLPFDFDISASPTRVSVAEGSTGTSTITIVSLNGFTGTVDLTHSLSVGTGLTCSLDPTSIAGGSGSSTLSCSGSAGTYAVTITGASGALSHSLDVIFDVTALADFSINASPTSVSMIAGGTGTSTVNVAGVNGFTETVDLTSTISPATGLTCSFSPASITGGSGTSTLSCSGSAGTYTVTVTGTSGTLSHSADVMFTVTAPPPDFTISASPRSVSFAEGGSGTSTITVAPLNGFTGTVDLTSSTSPGTGLTCSLTPTSITGGSGTSTLSCTGSANTYTLTVTGTSGLLAHRLGVTFDVTFLTPAQASQNLIDAVKSLHLSGSAQTSLLGPLNNIVKILSDKDPTNDITACDKLSSFINIVINDQRKGILTMEQAAQLRQLATNIMVQLGC